MQKLLNIIHNFSGKTIGVIGDVMLDHYIFGKVERISPEASVPIVKVKSDKFLLGGAGNTAANIAALGGDVFLIGRVGADITSKQAIRLLKENSIDVDGIIEDRLSPTIQKIRIVVNGQQIARLDRERIEYINTSQEKQLQDLITEHIKNWDAVVVSDYAKGIINKRFASFLVNICKKHKKIIVVDTKPQHFSFFKGVSVIKPNQKEAETISGIKIRNKKDLLRAGNLLRKRSGSDILISRGADGMTVFYGSQVNYLSSRAQEVFDVTGAGDTVTATVALALASGAALNIAAEIANIAAGLVVNKTGTATISSEELRNHIHNIVRSS